MPSRLPSSLLWQPPPRLRLSLQSPATPRSSTWSQLCARLSTIGRALWRSG